MMTTTEATEAIVPRQTWLLAFNEKGASDVERVEAFRTLYEAPKHEVLIVGYTTSETTKGSIHGDFASRRFWKNQNCSNVRCILDYFWFATSYWGNRYGGHLTNGQHSWLGPGGKVEVFFARGGLELFLPNDRFSQVADEIEAHRAQTRFDITLIPPEVNPLIIATNSLSNPLYDAHLSYLQRGQYFHIKPLRPTH